MVICLTEVNLKISAHQQGLQKCLQCEVEGTFLLVVLDSLCLIITAQSDGTIFLGDRHNWCGPFTPLHFSENTFILDSPQLFLHLRP